MNLGQVFFETFLLSKRAVTASFSSILRTYVREIAANPGTRVNRGGPGAHVIPGSDPNEIAKQLLARRKPGAVAAAPTAALPGQGLGMLQGANQPGPLGASLASSQLGTLPGGVTGAGRSVGEAGPMKMAAVQGLFAKRRWP